MFDTIYDLLLAEGDDPHPALVIVHSYKEDMLTEIFRHPLCTTESDATALCIDGPLAETTFLGAYTWASWFFRHNGKSRSGETSGKRASRSTAECGLVQSGSSYRTV